MKDKIKGSELLLGNVVDVEIKNEEASETNVFGEITAVQKYSNKIWIQVAGLDSWIILGDNVQVRVLVQGDN